MVGRLNRIFQPITIHVEGDFNLTCQICVFHRVIGTPLNLSCFDKLTHDFFLNNMYFELVKFDKLVFIGNNNSNFDRTRGAKY